MISRIVAHLSTEFRAAFLNVLGFHSSLYWDTSYKRLESEVCEHVTIKLHGCVANTASIKVPLAVSASNSSFCSTERLTVSITMKFPS